MTSMHTASNRSAKYVATGLPQFCCGHVQVADVLKLAQQKSLYPMIIFSFARIECEGFAMFVINEGKKTNSLDFTTEEEKATIEEVCCSCNKCVSLA